MDGKVIRIAAIIVVAAMILSVMPVVRAAPPPAPAFWITPETLSFDTNHYHVGDRFNATVWTKTLGPSYAWQVQVNFDVSQVNVVRADYTGMSKSLFYTGHATVGVAPSIDNTTGFVAHGESLVGLDQAAAGSGSLFWVEFMIMAEPVGEETLTSLISVDPNPDNTFILDPDSSSVPGVGMGFATYSLSYLPPVRDVAIVEVSFSNYRPRQGIDNVTITVVVLNNGTIPETFDVTIASDSPIVMLNVFDLGLGSKTTLTYEWNTSEVPMGAHTITATATVVPSDIDPTNNEKSKSLTVTSPTGPKTDINGDGIVNMIDIAMVAHAFGTQEGDARWIPAADVFPDGRINMIDIAMVARDFGRI